MKKHTVLKVLKWLLIFHIVPIAFFVVNYFHPQKTGYWELYKMGTALSATIFFFIGAFAIFDGV
jgi:hypothetical protein